MNDIYENLKNDCGIFNKTELLILKILYINNYDSFAHSYRACQWADKFFDQSGIASEYKNITIKSAAFHDIGKIFGDNLNLTPNRIEDKIVRQILHFHCQYGYLLLNDYNRDMALVSLYHHNSYEDLVSLNLEDYLVEIITYIRFCDIFDALTSKRSYKNVYSRKNTIKILSEFPEFARYVETIKNEDW